MVVVCASGDDQLHGREVDRDGQQILDHRRQGPRPECRIVTEPLDETWQHHRSDGGTSGGRAHRHADCDRHVALSPEQPHERDGQQRERLLSYRVYDTTSAMMRTELELIALIGQPAPGRERVRPQRSSSNRGASR